MTRISSHNSNKTTFNDVMIGLRIAGNFLQQSGIMGSIWTIAGQQDFSSTTPSNNNSSGTTETPKQTKKTGEEIKKDVLEILKENPSIKIDIESEEGAELLENVTSKHNAIVEWRPNISNEELTERITNYIKGYLYHQQENRFGLQGYAEERGLDAGFSEEEITNLDIDKANKEQDLTAYNNAFRQLAKEYIAYYDDDNNGKIDLREFNAKAIEEELKELGIERTKENADKIKAITEQVEQVSYRIFSNLNVNKEPGELEPFLDENEIAAFHWARNRWEGDGATLTYSEFNDFETALIGDLGLTDEQLSIVKNCQDIMNSHNLTFDDILKNSSKLDKLNEQERQTLQDGLESMKVFDKMNKNKAKIWIQNGYEGFKPTI